MKKIAEFLVLLIFIFCTFPKKSFSLPIKTSFLLTDIEKSESKPLSLLKNRPFFKCEEKTKFIFNTSGIEILPFMRVVLYDIDNDGIEEIIAGSKDGYLRLYKNAGIDNIPRWTFVEKYFDGIKVGAFSSPAVGDIDNDGRAEVLVGSGGFSSNSGEVIFYRNKGLSDRPEWEKIEIQKVDVGSDATPVLFDIDDDGRVDMIAGNSTGNLFLFRNRSRKDSLLFEKDSLYFKGLTLGMYVVPTVTALNNKIIIIAGNSQGKLYLLERVNVDKNLWKKGNLNISLSSFAAPAFVKSDQPKTKNMVITDGNGQLHCFKNKNDNYKEWEKSSNIFSDRIFPGAVCTPTISEINKKLYMVTGNINGEIKLFEYDSLANSLMPWIEKPGFFGRIKLSGFSKGILTEWYGKHLLITGQHDGIIRAFLSSGNLKKPVWVEQKQFFRGIPRITHASPAVFDIDGDGKLELMVGDVDGYVRGYHYETGKNRKPVWEAIKNSFDHVKVGRYAAPSFLKYKDKIYLFVGEQGGRVSLFFAENIEKKPLIFYMEDYLEGIHLKNHSSPSVFEKDGLIEISVGDYDGNLRHFTCEKEN